MAAARTRLVGEGYCYEVLPCHGMVWHKRFTPKGLHTTAQGCRAAATLGEGGRYPTNYPEKGLKNSAVTSLTPQGSLKFEFGRNRVTPLDRDRWTYGQAAYPA